MEFVYAKGFPNLSKYIYHTLEPRVSHSLAFIKDSSLYEK